MGRHDYVSPYGPYGDPVRCEVCQEIAYDLDDPGKRPCPHDRVLCGEPDCLATCPECRALMDADGYDPELDPLFDHTARPRDPGKEWAESSGFDATSNSYRKGQR